MKLQKEKENKQRPPKKETTKSKTSWKPLTNLLQTPKTKHKTKTSFNESDNLNRNYLKHKTTCKKHEEL